MPLKHQRGKTGKWRGVTYSRTADAESVVLNFAKVLTYSRVLLYTLREGEEREEKNGRGRGPAGVKVNDAMSVSMRRWMAKNDWGWLVR